MSHNHVKKGKLTRQIMLKDNVHYCTAMCALYCILCKTLGFYSTLAFLHFVQYIIIWPNVYKK